MLFRSGWFYHKNEEPHSLERLFETYLRTVGNNSTFNLNIPPMPNGKFDQKDINRLRELGELIKKEFKTNLAEGIRFEALEGFGETQPEYTLKLNKKQTVNYVEIAEKISEGQKVESFVVFYKNKDNFWEEAGKHTTIGSRKIIKINARETDEIKIRITSSRDIPIIEWIKLF